MQNRRFEGFRGGNEGWGRDEQVGSRDDWRSEGGRGREDEWRMQEDDDDRGFNDRSFQQDRWYGQVGGGQYGRGQGMGMRARSSWGQRDYSQRDFGQRDYGQRDFGQRDYGQRDYGQRDFGQRDYGQRDYSQRDYGFQGRSLRDIGRDIGSSLRGMGSSLGISRESTLARYAREQRLGDDYSNRAWQSDEEQGLGQRMVQGIKNIFRGPKGYQRSDERIREDVCDRLAHLSQHAQIDAGDVEVAVREGEVTLTGFVQDRRWKHLMEDVADDVYGVRDVHNQLRVRREEQLGTAGTTTTGSSIGLSDNGNRRVGGTNVPTKP